MKIINIHKVYSFEKVIYLAVYAGPNVSILTRNEIQIDSDNSVSQIEYPLGRSSKKGSHVYFLLIVVKLHYCDIRSSWWYFD